jgi:predicted ATP-grasp superfamily ATP-dependent carboligase
MQLTALGDSLASRFNLAGLFNVDFVRTEQAIWVIEVNPRYSASIEVLEQAGRFQSIQLHLQACSSASLVMGEPHGTEGFAGKAIVYAPQDAIVPPALDDLVRQWNVTGPWPGLADIPCVGEKLVRSQPVVTVLAAGSSMEAVEQELRLRVARVEQLLR